MGVSPPFGRHWLVNLGLYLSLRQQRTIPVINLQNTNFKTYIDPKNNHKSNPNGGKQRPLITEQVAPGAEFSLRLQRTIAVINLHNTQCQC